MMPAPLDISQGTILVAAPHSDDEIIGCGGLIAKTARTGRVFVVIATDSARLPGMIPLPAGEADNFRKERAGESLAALRVLGVPESNVFFLDMPCGELADAGYELEKLLEGVIAKTAPDRILTPFRRDSHPDHCALNAACRSLRNRGIGPSDILEYFVYYRRRLLRMKDIRRYVRDEFRVQVDMGSDAALKRKALDCFKTQTTLRHPFQTRPVLTAELLDEYAAGPEIFMRCPEDAGMSRIFPSAATWIRIADSVEPALKRVKDCFNMRLKKKCC